MNFFAPNSIPIFLGTSQITQAIPSQIHDFKVFYKEAPTCGFIITAQVDYSACNFVVTSSPDSKSCGFTVTADPEECD